MQAALNRKDLINASEQRRPTSVEIPSSAKVVICGGGAQGAAIAYKLAEYGMGNGVLLLEQGELGGGTSMHATGLLSVLKSCAQETRIAITSQKLYRQLEEKGWYTGMKTCGSLYVAKRKDRMLLYKRMKAAGVQFGLECKILSPEEVKEYCGLIRTDDLLGGLWVPGDGVANPFEICLALGNEAIDMGVTVIEHCQVHKVNSEDGCVKSVETSHGNVKCEYFINSAGFWSRHVGEISDPKVAVPIHPAEHYHLHTKPVPDLPPDTPVVRDPDGYIYFRENEGRFLAGGFEPKAKPAYQDDNLPSHRQDLDPDWDHFHLLLENILHRVPAMKSAVLEKLCTGAEAFSPDGKWVLGQAPETANYYVAAGMRSNGISSAGGVGTVIADWIVKGRPPFDLYGLDISRCLGMHNNKRFLRDRVKEVPGLNSAIDFPYAEFNTGRALRTSPIFPKLQIAGAQFGQVMGYERPMFFKMAKPQSLDFGLLGLDAQEEAGSSQGETLKLPIAKTETFYRPPWFQAAAEEFQASREAVTLCDYSSFAKMDLWSSGREVVDFLQYLCSNDVDIPIGHIVHTGMQNQYGGYENDCSVARLAENRYMLMSPSIQQMRSYTWLKRHLPKEVVLQDVTSLYTALCVMGPFSRALVARLTQTSLDSRTFPFFTARYLDIACAPEILTMNMTHTGELGYVFYIPNEFALHVYNAIVEAGKTFGLKHCGYYAMRAVRIEKFYAFWGQDLDSHTTPMECGRGFRCKMKSDIPFLGREALQQQLDHGIKKLFVMLLLDPIDHSVDLDPWPWGGEPIYRDGKYCGTVTTTSYGFSLHKQICLGFIQDFGDDGKPKTIGPDFIKNAEFEVDICGVNYPAQCRLNPPILPKKVMLEGPEAAALRHQNM